MDYNRISVGYCSRCFTQDHLTIYHNLYLCRSCYKIFKEAEKGVIIKKNKNKDKDDRINLTDLCLRTVASLILCYIIISWIIYIFKV